MERCLWTKLFVFLNQNPPTNIFHFNVIVLQQCLCHPEVLTAEQPSPRGRVSTQLLLQLEVQLSGVKGCSAAI